MTIQTVEEFKEIGKEWVEKLPAAPAQIMVQDSVVVALYLYLKELENTIKILETASAEYEKLVAYLQTG